MSENSTDETTDERAIELLRELGQKQYEAKCFTALARLSAATAKEVSECTDVPRTRVYDAMRSLEAQGLVEVQHSSPQRFRALSVEEATDLLRKRYVTRTNELETLLENIEPIEEVAGDPESVAEIWSLTDADAIAGRTRQLIEDADEEVALVIGDESAFSEELLAALEAAWDRGVNVFVGTGSDSVRERVKAASIEAFISGLDWLRSIEEEEDGVSISRLLMVDRSVLLVSSIDADGRERAIFGGGVGNAFVVIVRRLLATGLDGATGDD